MTSAPFRSCPGFESNLRLDYFRCDGGYPRLGERDHSRAVRLFHAGSYVDGFWSPFLGALTVSLVSVLLIALFGEEKERPERS